MASDNGRFQTTLRLKSRSKGCHLVTDEIVSGLGDALKNTKIGILFLFLQHTSAALTLNENCDPTVRTDMDRLLDAVVPESFDWEHVDEGPDDSVSHSKSSLVGVSLQIPISNGRLALGTWQGVYLTEFRHMSHSRKVVCTII
ncbi:YjbQ family protein [Rhodotorula paludigena]|uniref:YjbQ family protein n=1 Tax=Rhodotorula paludigena TaxID=86838 RepID=UPI0031805300